MVNTNRNLLWFVLPLVLGLITACSTGGAAQPTAAPTEIPAVETPTGAAVPTEAPTIEMPTVTPQATATPEATVATVTEEPTGLPTVVPTETANILPAPLYFINDENQIARFEPDARTITPITSEEVSVFDFTISPLDGSLVYLTIGDDGVTTTVVRSDALGKNRVELAQGIVRSAAISYFGDTVEIGVLDDGAESNGSTLEAGVWSIPITGGEPRLLEASTDPQTDDAGEVVPGTHYLPVAWSPSGEQLLLRTTLNYGPDGPGGDIGTVGLALYDRQENAVRELLPKGEPPLCAIPAWDSQSVSVYCAAPFYLGDETPALWSLAVVTGAREPLIPLRDGEQINLVSSVRELSDGLYMLTATTTLDGGTTPEFTAQRTALDGRSEQQVLIQEPLTLGGDALWANDASGVVLVLANDGESELVWQPFRGGERLSLVNGINSTILGWGKP